MGVGQLAGEQVGEVGRGIGPQGQHVPPAVLAVSGFHGNGRVPGVTVEARSRQAGQFAAAQHTLAPLLEKNPKNGHYQYLQASILSAPLAADAPLADVKKVQDAWGALLLDPAIRQRAPERYWEARYNWLALHLRLGQAADVEKAITQEHVWYPDLGGPPWSEKLEALRAQARERLGLPAETEPTTQAATQPGRG